MARKILICLTRQEDKVYTRASQFEFERATSHSKTSIHEREMSLFGLLTSGICLGIQETTHESVCVCVCVLVHVSKIQLFGMVLPVAQHCDVRNRRILGCG